GRDDPLDHRAQHAVVDGVVERVRLSRDREVDDHVEIDFEGLGLLLLLSKRAAVPRDDEPSQLYLVGHVSPKPASEAPRRWSRAGGPPGRAGDAPIAR